MLAFGADHPYGRPGRGFTSTVEQDHPRPTSPRSTRRYWKPASSALVFVGDITLAEATELARQHFGSWTGAAPPAQNIPAPQPAAAGKVYLVDRQDAAQTVVAASACRAPQRKSDDYYACHLADAVWGGGGFGTRLNLNLREDKGYSYGVFSNPVQYDRGSIWVAAGGVQTNKTKESLVEFVKRAEGASPAASRSRPRSWPTPRATACAATRSSSSRWASSSGRWRSSGRNGLPMTELQRVPTRRSGRRWRPSTPRRPEVRRARQVHAHPRRRPLEDRGRACAS